MKLHAFDGSILVSQLFSCFFDREDMALVFGDSWLSDLWSHFYYKFQINPPNSDLCKTCLILFSIQFLMTRTMSDQQYCNFANSNTNHSYFKQRWLLKLNLESSVVIVIMLTWSDTTKGGHQHKRCKYLQSLTFALLVRLALNKSPILALFLQTEKHKNKNDCHRNRKATSQNFRQVRKLLPNHFSFPVQLPASQHNVAVSSRDGVR